jgi:hypothetical protein
MAMSRARIEAIVRQFPQNGLKLLLEDPRNVRELLAVAGVAVLDLIDFEHMTRAGTTFVQRDYRHVEADVVLRAPLHRPGKGRGRRRITIYILIEHQSEPDPVMALRVLEYVVQIYRAQAREWDQRHRSFAGLRLQPVLPVVLYTGAGRWDALGRLADLVEMGERFAAVIPAHDPLFVNLGGLPPARLESPGGFFGWVLRLVQQRHARPAEFQGLLRRAVAHLEGMPAAERLRWLELLSHIHALVYYERNPAEHPGLQGEIEASVRTDEHRQEVAAMGRTIADELRAQGRKEGAAQALQQAILRHLRRRFGEPPPETVAAVEAATSVKQLNGWLDRVITAARLEDIDIR